MANSALIKELFIPRTNYAQKSAAKKAEIQYAEILAKQGELEVERQKQGLSVMQDTISKLNSLPLEAPDKIKVSKFISEKKKELSSYIQENFSDVGSFLKNGSQAWSKKFFDEITTSKDFLEGVQNTSQVALAKEAMKKGETLIGSSKNGVYNFGEQELADYYDGKSSYKFRGSYDPTKIGKDMRDYFSKQDNPNGKYSADSKVSKEDINNFLSGVNTQEALDYVSRNKGAVFNYKKYSPEDESLFKVDLMDKKAGIASKTANTSLTYKKIEKLDSETSDKKKSDTENYFESTTKNQLKPSSPSEVSVLTGSKSIGGQTIMDMSTPDANTGKMLFNLNSYNFSEATPLILKKNGFKEASFSQGQLTPESIGAAPMKGISSGEVSAVLDLTGLKVGMLSTDGNLYRPSSFFSIEDRTYKDKRGQQYNDGFLKAVMVVEESDKDKVVMQLGLKNASKMVKIPPSTTLSVSGTKIDPPAYYKFEMLVPVSDLTNDAVLNKQLTKKQSGLKVSNENEYYNTSISID